MVGFVKSLELLKLLSAAPACALSKAECVRKLAISKDDLDGICVKLKTQVQGFYAAGEIVGLAGPFQFLDEDFLFKNSHGKGRVCVIPSIDSTNSEILRDIESYTDGDTILAERQSSGRGRRGKKWSGFLGCQVLLSCAEFFRRDCELNALPLAVGLGVAIALEDAGFAGIKVKWPNDLYYKDGKIAGILIESVYHQEKVGVVIGIGINVFPFRDETLSSLNKKIAALAQINPQQADRNLVALTVINSIRKVCTEYKNTGFEPFRDCWPQYDYLIGKEVVVDDDVNKKRGVCAGIDAHGALLLESNGRVQTVQAGHVEFI